MSAAQSESRSNATLDEGSRQVGAVYAKAFLAAAEKAGQREALIAELDEVVELLRVMPKFDEILSSSIVVHADKERLLDQALGGKASPLLLNFLKVVSSHGRLDCLRGIRAVVHEQNDAALNRIPIEMTTASPVDDALANKIAEKLKAMLGAEPRLQRHVQPDLIGGIVLRVGDTLYDGSVATQLALVREQMINRSVHEIQSRRDRFRNPTGS